METYLDEFREAKNFSANSSLTRFGKNEKTRNRPTQAYDLENVQKNANNTFQNFKKSNAFGSTIINRCKSKELNFFIEKASRMVREISGQREQSFTRSVGRDNSGSVEKRNYEFTDASPLIPSTRISLQREKSELSQSINANLASHFRTRTVNSGKAFQPLSSIKCLTQKNSFVGMRSIAEENPLRTGNVVRNRASLKTNPCSSSLVRTPEDQKDTDRASTVSRDNPFETESRKSYQDNLALKCTKSVRLDMSPK